MSGRVATPHHHPPCHCPAGNSVVCCRLGDSWQRQRGVCAACPCSAAIDIKVKTTYFFFAFSLVLFGTFSLSAPWVVCCVRLSEVREGRMGGRGSLYCVEIYLGGFYINLNYFVFPALKLKLAAVPRITRLFFSPLTHTQRFSLSLFFSAVCHSCLINHLRKERYCPRCEMVINNAKPNIK